MKITPTVTHSNHLTSVKVPKNWIKRSKKLHKEFWAFQKMVCRVTGQDFKKLEIVIVRNHWKYWASYDCWMTQGFKR